MHPLPRGIVTLASLVLILNLTSCGGSGGGSSSSFTVKGTANTGNARSRAAISGGFVGAIIPKSTGWTAKLFTVNSGVANKVTTGTDGSFTFPVELSAYTQYDDRSFFVAVSDAAQTYTRLVAIPVDKIAGGAEISVVIDDVSTTTAILHCPGGKYPPPTGAYCYEDPNDSTHTATLAAAIETAIEDNAALLQDAPNWPDVISSAIGIPEVFDAVNAILTDLGLTPATIQGEINGQVLGTTLPKITAPHFLDKNDGTCGTATNQCAAGTICVSTRSCVKGISCSCAGTVLGTCEDVSECGGSGSDCGSGSPCCAGLSCVNGECEYSINSGQCPESV